MEIAVGILIVSGLVFCFLLWAEVIKLNFKSVKEEAWRAKEGEET